MLSRRNSLSSEVGIVLSTQSAGFLYRSMRSLTVYMYMSARCLCSLRLSLKSPSIITAIRSKMKRRDECPSSACAHTRLECG